MFIPARLTPTACADPTESLPISSPDHDLARPSWWQSILAAIPADFRRRSGGLALALGIELLIALLLLSLGLGRSEDEREFVTISSFDVGEPPAPVEEQADTAPQQAQAEPQSAVADLPPQPQAETPHPPALDVVPLPYRLPIPEASPAPAPTPTPSSRIGAVVRADRSYGPPDTGYSRGEDSPVVGTAPDGSPLYAASWYREPTQDQLAGYLSTARSAGWGLIACKTAPNWRVEDCEIVGESPANSGIARAVQAAAWQFRVRPPRIGGEYQVGSWVRIRIDYRNQYRIR